MKNKKVEFERWLKMNEADRTTRLTRVCVLGAASAFLAAVALVSVTQKVSLSAMAAGLSSRNVTRVNVQDVVIQKSEKRTNLQEHTSSTGEFEIAPKPVQKTPIVPDAPKPEKKRTPVTKTPPKTKIAPQPSPASNQSESQEQNSNVEGSDTQGASGSDSFGIAGAGGDSHEMGSAHHEASRDAVLRAILSAYETHKRYPRRARMNGVQGRVLLTLTLTSKGCVTQADLTERSGSVLLDNAAQRAADPLIGRCFGALEATRLNVPVLFQLNSQN